MAEYHVGCGAFGIYAGTLNSRSRTAMDIDTALRAEAATVRQQCVLPPMPHGKRGIRGYKPEIKHTRNVGLEAAII